MPDDAHRQYRLLLVDDNPAFLDMLADLLTSADDRFVIKTATGGQAALEHVRAEPVDCVVSGHEMAGMDGLELFVAVRVVHPDVRFVLMSNANSRRLSACASSVEVDGFYPKVAAVNRYPEMGSHIRTLVNAAPAD